MDFAWYTTIGGIVVATMVIVEVLKRLVGNVTGFEHVPTWAYAVLVSALLTVGSKMSGLLIDTGTLFELVMKAVMMAGAASGFKTWLGNLTTPISESKAAVAQRSNF